MIHAKSLLPGLLGGLALFASAAAIAAPGEAPPTPVPARQGPQVKATVLTPAELAALIHNETLAVNQANITGDYTIVHKLAAARFRQQNSPESLAASFAPFRDRRIDLTMTAVIAPQLTATPGSGAGQIRLEGFYPSEPVQTWFRFEFVMEDGRWKAIAIGLSMDGPVQVPGPQAK